MSIGFIPSISVLVQSFRFLGGLSTPKSENFFCICILRHKMSVCAISSVHSRFSNSLLQIIVLDSFHLPQFLFCRKASNGASSDSKQLSYRNSQRQKVSEQGGSTDISRFFYSAHSGFATSVSSIKPTIRKFYSTQTKSMKIFCFCSLGCSFDRPELSEGPFFGDLSFFSNSTFSILLCEFAPSKPLSLVASM